MAKQVEIKVEFPEGFVGASSCDVTATITPKQQIRIAGRYHGTEFDKTFQMGDTAEYDSYNLSYMGKIVSITPNTIFVEYNWDSFTKKRRRLNLWEFTWRNYDFNVARAAADNLNEMQYL